MRVRSRDAISYGLNVLPQHEHLLDESAIASEVARARGYRSATHEAEVEALGFKGKHARVPALVIPLYNAQGVRALYQLRPDDPRKDANGKDVKYETPARERLIID